MQSSIRASFNSASGVTDINAVGSVMTSLIKNQGKHNLLSRVMKGLRCERREKLKERKEREENNVI